MSRGAEAQVRVPRASLITKLKGVAYPPIVEDSKKSKSVQPEKRKRSSQRAGTPSGSDRSLPKKLKDAGPGYKIPIPNHTVFTNSVIDLEDAAKARDYMRGLSSPADWRRLAGLSHKAFYDEMAIRFTQLMPVVAQHFTRTDVECTDANHIAGIAQANEVIVRLNGEKEELKMRLEKKERELQEAADVHKQTLKKLSEQRQKAMQAMYGTGFKRGKEEFLYSKAGLEMVGRIQGVTREAALHSDEVKL